MATRKRSELNEKFVHELALDFDTHGSEVIEKLRQTDLRAYSQLIAALVPKRIEVSGGDDFSHLTEEELNRAIVSMDAMDISAAERRLELARALATQGPVVVNLPDRPSPTTPSRRIGRRPGLPVVRQ